MIQRWMEDDELSSSDFDLDQIFIGREQQQHLFTMYLGSWKKYLYHTETSTGLSASTPSPSNRIQSLMVLLYGRGGFGKSTLLRHYHEIVQKENPLSSKLVVSNIIDWESEIGNRRSIFNIQEGLCIDPLEYFKLLSTQIAIALGKSPKDFSNYQMAVRDIEKVDKKAQKVIDGLQKEDNYAWLRNLTVETVTTMLRTYVPGSNMLLNNNKVMASVNEIAKITQEQTSQIYAKMHNKLGDKLGDYLDPTARLGLALGLDLCECAKSFPLLIFFDTYEEIDEGDNFLRLVMGAAGPRVGWVIAGRDNL